MRSTNVIALFCEDIREEKGDIFTLIGILPDNVNLADTQEAGASAETPRILPRISLYVRINYEPDTDIGVPQVKLLMPDGGVIELAPVEESIVKAARTNAKEKGNALAGLILRIMLGNFRPPADGIVKVQVELKNETYLAGALTFKLQHHG